MEIRELRIGNLVSRPDLADGHTRIETIIELGAKATCTGPIKVICGYDNINPIPITEDWCEKLGLFGEKHIASGLEIGFSKPDNIELLFDSNGGMTYEGVYLPHIKYVH